MSCCGYTYLLDRPRADDPTVPPGSKTPTFAAVTLFIDNDRCAALCLLLGAAASKLGRCSQAASCIRWPVTSCHDRQAAASMVPTHFALPPTPLCCSNPASRYARPPPLPLFLRSWAGVPFVLKAGKALDDRKAEIRVQLRPTPHFVFGGDPETARNEVRNSTGGWLLVASAAAAAQLSLCSQAPALGVALHRYRSVPARNLHASPKHGGQTGHSRLITLASSPQLVVRLQPDEAIYLKMIVKRPGALGLNKGSDQQNTCCRPQGGVCRMIVKRPGAAEEGGVWVQRSTKHSATVLDFCWPVNTGTRHPLLQVSPVEMQLSDRLQA